MPSLSKMRAAAFLSVIVLGGCAWGRKTLFSSPTGSTSLEIQQRFRFNLWGIRVLLHKGESIRTLYEMRGDTFLTFMDVFWSTDNRSLAVFTCGLPSLRMAYDLIGDRALPFDELQPGMTAHIRTEYHLDPKNMSDKETLLWACTDGRETFAQRHPEAVVR